MIEIISYKKHLGGHVYAETTDISGAIVITNETDTILLEPHALENLFKFLRELKENGEGA